MRKRLYTVCVISASLFLVGPSNAVAQDNANRAATEILALYKDYDVVMMGEQHGLKQNHDFRIALIRHPEFAEIVDDIVIESGNALYQDTLDEYILDLKDVSNEELQRVWRNTTQTSGVWDISIYEEFIRAVRKVNEELPTEKRIRLLAGDPPIDWSNVKDVKDLEPHFSQRDISPVRIMATEVLARKRKAFLIYGNMHIARSNFMAPEYSEKNITTHLEKVIPGRIFVLMPFCCTNESSLELVRSMIGGDYPRFVDLRESEVFSLNSRESLPFSARILADTADGIIFLGPHEEIYVDQDESVLLDEEYQKERRRRGDIVYEAIVGRSPVICKDE